MDGGRGWEANPEATFVRRLGVNPASLPGEPTKGKQGCPDIWEMSNGVTVVHDERLVVIRRVTIVAAKKDIPDA